MLLRLRKMVNFGIPQAYKIRGEYKFVAFAVEVFGT